MCQVLLVDNDTCQANATAAQLRRMGHVVVVAPDGTTALRELYQSRPDLIVLDLLLPGIDGFETCRLIRFICDIPILILTSLKGEQDVVRSLDLGADEYLVKPVGVVELAFRVQAVLRRSQRQEAAATLRVGDVEVDIERRVVTKAGAPVSLTPTEFRLLQALAERAGRLCTHKYLLDRVWGPDWREATHYLRLYIGYLRQKLEDDPRHPRHIVNEWGAGYRLVTEAPQPVPMSTVKPITAMVTRSSPA